MGEQHSGSGSVGHGIGKVSLEALGPEWGHSVQNYDEGLNWSKDSGKGVERTYLKGLLCIERTG